MTNIVDWLGNIAGAIGNGFTAVVQGVLSLPGKILDGLDYLFNPSSAQLEGDFGAQINEVVSSKFKFIDQFKSSLGALGKQGGVLVFKANLFGQEFTVVDGAKLDQFVPYLRGGLSALFWVMLFLSCFRLISSVFGMGLGKSVGAVANDNS